MSNNKGCPYRPCCKLSKTEKGLICANYGKGCNFYISHDEAKERGLKAGLNQEPKYSKP